MSTSIDTSSIGYNYSIMYSLFYSKNKNVIDKEVTKLINDQIDLMIAFKQNDSAVEQLKFIIDKFFVYSSILGKEQGQLGMPQIKDHGVYKPVVSVDELKNRYIPSLNFREKMSIVRNFSAKNDCLMYEILLEYTFQKNTGNISAFELKYPMLDTTYLDHSINLIEEILGFDIIETEKCYDNINGSREIVRPGCKPFYKMIQEDYQANPTGSPITLCWLWHPLVYGVPYQDVIKLPADNKVKTLSTSFTNNNKELIPGCMTETFMNYPILPPLSEREQMFIKSELNENPLVDGLYQRPPWTPPICFMKQIEPTSFYVNLQKQYNKFFVSNLSGHVMLFLITSRYFKNINLNYIILANLLFMVPYNHSIHEIFQAAKVMGINTSYSIKKNDLDNLNEFLTESDLEPITLSKAATIQVPQDRPKFTKSYSKGGRRKKTKRNKRNKKTKRRRLNHRKTRKH
tara:strand:- start:2652 stop:4025 length:1374 start_codon:yes stop_codon:yes gene_type:complete